MTRPTLPQMRIDPFFDADGSGNAPVPPRPVISATPESPNGYRSVDGMTVRDGRPATAVMRSGPEGLRGTVIPRATMGGIPLGTRPHVLQDLRVTIDPHIDGQSSVVRLGDINPAAVAAATQAAIEATPDPYDMPTQRLRGAAVMHGISAMSQPQVQPQSQPIRQPAFEGPTVPGNIPAEYTAHYAQQVQPPVNRRVSSPLQAFGQRQPHVDDTGRPFRQIDMRAAPPELAPAPQPSVVVSFEIEHFGTHTAVYHDVVVRPGFLVLVYNNTCRAGGRYFPPTGEQSPAMALNIEGRDEVYLVHTTGFQYTYGDFEFCVLMVERVGTMSLPPSQPAE